jgi:uncharacterized protein involved in tolerance to divalent cations
MDRAVFVYTTFPPLVEAEAAARVIVEQRLATPFQAGFSDLP